MSVFTLAISCLSTSKNTFELLNMRIENVCVLFGRELQNSFSRRKSRPEALYYWHTWNVLTSSFFYLILNRGSLQYCDLFFFFFFCHKHICVPYILNPPSASLPTLSISLWVLASCIELTLMICFTLSF